MPRRYLIISDGEKIHCKLMRKPWRQFDYETIRRFLTELYPNQTIVSPLETMPPNGKRVIAYVSTNKLGMGRIDYGFQEWGVGC
jgi:hypothetical protein